MKRDFLAVTDFSKEEIYETFRIAKQLKADVKNGKTHHYFANQTMSMVFAKPSLRTRVSFETGMVQFGGHALYLGPKSRLLMFLTSFLYCQLHVQAASLLLTG